MIYTDYTVCFKWCRVIMWNDAELSYAHTRWNRTLSFEQPNRLLSLEHSNVANESIKQRDIHIYYIFPAIPSWMPYEITSFELKTIEKIRTNWRYVGRYVDAPCMLFTITSARLTIDKFTIYKWLIPIITFVLNDAE
jgi:hypothetical protein